MANTPKRQVLDEICFKTPFLQAYIPESKKYKFEFGEKNKKNKSLFRPLTKTIKKSLKITSSRSQNNSKLLGAPSSLRLATNQNSQEDKASFKASKVNDKPKKTTAILTGHFEKNSSPSSPATLQKFQAPPPLHLQSLERREAGDPCCKVLKSFFVEAHLKKNSWPVEAAVFVCSSFGPC